MHKFSLTSLLWEAITVAVGIFLATSCEWFGPDITATFFTFGSSSFKISDILFPVGSSKPLMVCITAESLLIRPENSFIVLLKNFEGTATTTTLLPETPSTELVAVTVYGIIMPFKYCLFSLVLLISSASSFLLAHKCTL